MRVAVLVDQESGHEGAQLEWGASVLIERDDVSILFDMGASGMFADNACALGLSVADVDHAVLSHGHLDHGGGIERFCAENATAPIWARADVGEEAFLKIGPLKKPVGLDSAMLERCRDRFRFVDGDTEIAPGIHLLTGLRGAFAPPTGNRLLWRQTDNGLARDDFGHETMLVVDDPDGLALFTSCSHNGILNMIAAAQARLPGRPIKAVVGGFHFVGLPVANLFGDDDAAIRAIAEGIKGSGIPRVLTTHCTGKAGYERLRAVLGTTIEYAGAGATFDL